jgi:predicted amino acid dehydrogenase
VHLSLIGLFYTSEQLFRAYQSRHDETVIKQIEKAIELAGARGCTVAGLGGFHSIITQNGNRLRSMRIGLTSGNALTVGMGTPARAEAAARNGMDMRGATLGVVGATGNVGQAYALVMAAKLRRVVLITNKGGSARCLSFVQRLREVAPAIETEVSESLDALQSCSLIAAASNSPEPLVNSHHLGGHGTVICDISLPPNVSSEVTVNRPTSW